MRFALATCTVVLNLRTPASGVARGACDLVVDARLSRVALTVCVCGFVLVQTKTKDIDSEYGLKLRDQVLQALYAKRVAAEASQPSLESA